MVMKHSKILTNIDVYTNFNPEMWRQSSTQNIGDKVQPRNLETKFYHFWAKAEMWILRELPMAALVDQSELCVLSHFSRVQLFATLWTVTHQAPLSMGFSRQEYWSGLPCLSPGELPDPGVEPVSLMSPALAGSVFTTSATWEAPNKNWQWESRCCSHITLSAWVLCRREVPDWSRLDMLPE